MSARCLLLFTKPAHPGRVKTRLIGDLTPAQTAELHAALLADTLATLEGGRFDLRVMWGVEPDEPLPVWPPGGQRQEGADLGARLFRALTDAARDYPRVAAIGSDCPEIDQARIEDALSRLGSGIEVGVGPSAG